MNPDLERVVENAKEWTLEEVAASRCLCVGPCLFQFIACVPTNVAAAVQADVYDGQDDQGNLKVTIKFQYACPCCKLPQPSYFRRGLYVNLTTNIGKAFVQYLPLRD
jgi:hypothetical protein